MKQFLYITVLTSLLICSCGTNGTEDDDPMIGGGGVGVEREYKFLSVDALKPELKVTYYPFYGGGIDVELEFANKISQYVLEGELVKEKEHHLREQLKHFGLYRHPYEGDFVTYFIYAGISGEVKLFADEEINNRKAGEDLSDMFECFVGGRIKYPDMDVVADKHLLYAIEHNTSSDDVSYNYKDYYSDSIIPIVGVNGIFSIFNIRPSKDYSHLLDSSLTLHFAFPITGLDKEGNEKSMVLTGVCSTAPQE
ncbi:MAG: hypothetical protein J6X39_02440 [Bacteroidales bacterium]|nr:hypothetical protein [Bacteroidales bacterium]